jgi:hypothetical protein
VVPAQPVVSEPVPPRRFAPLASIEPEDNEPVEPRHHAGHSAVHHVDESETSARASHEAGHAVGRSHHSGTHSDVRSAEAEAIEPHYEETVEPVTPQAHQPARKSQALSDADMGLPLDEDDLDVPAFIRRKVE